MPRAPRIEYENAAYHVMARGNHRQEIVFSDADRVLFAETLAEACAPNPHGPQAFGGKNRPKGTEGRQRETASNGLTEGQERTEAQ